MSLTPGQLVRQITGTVEIAGTDRTSQVTSVTVDREIATTLPTTAAAGGGLSKATGTIELTDPGVVAAQTRTSPWARSAGWPPARADSVTVDATVNDGPAVRRFTGRVSAVNGSATDSTKINIEDLTDNLKVSFSQDPLLRTMPPPGTGGGDPLHVGLRADYLANQIFRKAGFNTTPPTMGTVIIDVPAQGSMWPSRGSCRTCDDVSTGAGLPDWVAAPWGWAVSDVKATYSLPGSTTTLRGQGLAQGMCVAPEHSAYARIDTTLGTVTLSLVVLGNRQVSVRVNNSAVGSNLVPDAGWTRIEAIWSQALGGVRVHTDTGWSRLVPNTFGAAVLDGTHNTTTLEVNSDGAAAGFIVQFVGNTYSGGYTAATQSATIVPGTLLTHMRAMPAITSRDGLDLLTEISQATVTSMWIDRDGHLWWVHPDRLYGQDPALELTATKDLLDLAWEDTSDSARAAVTLTYDDPTIQRKDTHKLKAWEGGGDNLKQGESAEEILSPSGDTDWIEVDGLGKAIYATPTPSNPDALPDFNRGIGSWVGGTHLNSDGDSAASMYADDVPLSEINTHNTFPDLARSFEKIGPAAWKISTGLNDISNNYWIEIQQALDPFPPVSQFPQLGSKINKSWTGQKLPIIRCKAITEWTESSATSSVTGPVGYQDLNHESGPWVGDGASALADWIAEQVTHPTPILDGFPINYRSDVHLGMVIDIVEDAVYNIQIRALVIGIKESHELANSTLDLTCRVITVERLSWTYDEQSRYWDIKGGTYNTQSATGQTYTQVETPPADLADVLDTPLIEPLPAPIIDWPDETEVGS